jgi:type II secretory pathway predicted ATPase ExeA
MLEYGIESQASFCLLTGQIGSGKTTVMRQLLKMLQPSYSVGLISNTQERFVSVVPWALSAFGIVPAKTGDIGQHEALADFIIGKYAKGGRTLLIIDEAQNLSIQGLEELRLLSNINSESDVALQIMLVGQPELRAKLERPELAQFAQRVGVDFHLEALTLGEARSYIQHRLSVAGGEPTLFQPEAIAGIHARAAGIPRLINQLCDLALVYAFAEQRRCIDLPLIKVVIYERERGRTALSNTSDSPAVVSLT